MGAVEEYDVTVSARVRGKSGRCRNRNPQGQAHQCGYSPADRPSVHESERGKPNRSK